MKCSQHKAKLLSFGKTPGTCHKSEDPHVRRPTSPMSTSPTAHKCDVHKSDGPQVRRPQVRRPTSPMTTSSMTTSPTTTSPMSVCVTVLDTYERMVETTFVGLKLTKNVVFLDIVVEIANGNDII